LPIKRIEASVILRFLEAVSAGCRVKAHSYEADEFRQQESDERYPSVTMRFGDTHVAEAGG
jgi:hypothetical protein